MFVYPIEVTLLPEYALSIVVPLSVTCRVSRQEDAVGPNTPSWQESNSSVEKHKSRFCRNFDMG